MRKLWIVSLMAGVALTCVSAAFASEPRVSGFQIWHRLNPQNSSTDPTPEHQRYSCLEGVTWRCRYDKLPEPRLNFFWDRDRGSFVGEDVTANWTCPAWFPFEACQNVITVVRGPAIYENEDGSSLTVDQELIVAGSGAETRLSMYWVDQFVCPWFQTFEAALLANPFPLPYDGVHSPQQACTGSP
jgi:hypothetical protein